MAQPQLYSFVSMSENEVNTSLRFLHSLLDIPHDSNSPIRLIHPSFRHFLLDSQKCSSKSFWIDKERAHSDLVKRCLELMTKTLKRIFTIYAHIDLLHMRMRVIIMGFPQMCNMYIFNGLTTWVKWATIGLINVMMNKSIKSFKINVPIGLRRLVSWRKCLKECLYNEVWIDARGL